MTSEVDRVVVTGHAGEVGIIGWSFGGGHSPLGPLHGLGVDQMLEVEMIGPDGSLIIANEMGTYMRAPGKAKFDIFDTFKIRFNI